MDGTAFFSLCLVAAVIACSGFQFSTELGEASDLRWSQCRAVVVSSGLSRPGCPN